jgi:hypothetical protein
MRNAVTFVIAVAALGLGQAQAKSIKITEQQMKNVCGKNVESGGGHTGCSKVCGQFICDYDCTKKAGKTECKARRGS